MAIPGMEILSICKTEVQCFRRGDVLFDYFFLTCVRSRRRNDSKAVYLTPEERRLKLVSWLSLSMHAYMHMDCLSGNFIVASYVCKK